MNRARAGLLRAIGWSLAILLAVAASFVYLQVDSDGLLSGEGLRQMLGYASDFFPPDLSATHLSAVGRGALGYQAPLGRILERGLVELLDVGSEGRGLGENEPARLRRVVGEHIDVHRAVAVHGRDDRQAVATAGDRAHP